MLGLWVNEVRVDPDEDLLWGEVTNQDDADEIETLMLATGL